MTHAIPQPDRILRLPEVAHVTGTSRSQIYRLVKAGKFPAPVKLGQRSSGWKFHEVQAWIDSLEPAR
jgi:prophage regulatory protein